jgi:hypothetical protein
MAIVVPVPAPLYACDKQARLQPIEWAGPEVVTAYGERTRHSRSMSSMKMVPQVCYALMYKPLSTVSVLLACSCCDCVDLDERVVVQTR